MLVWSILILTTGSAVAYVEYDIDQAEVLFEQFIQDYNRAYKDIEEKQMRFNIFRERLLEINEHNKQHGYNVMGINLFTDISKEEFRRTRLGLVFDGNEAPCTVPIIDSDIPVSQENLPENFDWREKGVVTDVKDQQYCGGCWAFSITGNLEGQYAIKHGADHLTALSEQQLIDCLETETGCNGGYMSRAILHLQDSQKGVMAEADYPYVGHDGECKYDQNKVVVNVTGCVDYTNTTEEDIKSILVSKGPLIIGLAGEPLFGYRSGVFKHCSADAPISHALLLVGYGTDKDTKDPYWLIKNSWGRNYGENGYIRLVRGNPSCRVGESQLITAQVA